RLIAREVASGLSVGAVNLADRAPLALAEVRPPEIPVAGQPQSVLEPAEAGDPPSLGAHRSRGRAIIAGTVAGHRSRAGRADLPSTVGSAGQRQWRRSRPVMRAAAAMSRSLVVGGAPVRGSCVGAGGAGVVGDVGGAGWIWTMRSGTRTGVGAR